MYTIAPSTRGAVVEAVVGAGVRLASVLHVHLYINKYNSSAHSTRLKMFFKIITGACVQYSSTVVLQLPDLLYKMSLWRRKV